MDTDDVVGHVRDLGGVARTADLLRRGVSRRALGRARDRGALASVGQGCLAVPGAPPELVAAVRVRGAITCVSALVRYGLPLRAAPEQHHVAIDTSRGAPRHGLLPPAVRLHWSGPTRARDHVVPPAVALSHAARCLPLPDLVAALDAALARGLADRVDLAAQHPRAGAAVFGRAITLADARSGSFQESVVRVALVGAGLDVEPQVHIPGVGRVDLLIERRIVLEADGFAYHADRAAFREDRRRDRRLELAGYPVLRYAFEDAVHGIDQLVDEVTGLAAATRGTTAEGRPRRARRAGERRG